MKIYILTFLTAGTVATLVVYFQMAGFPLISRVAALFPVVTWVSYLFLGFMKDGSHISRHALFVLLGTLCAWIPYMLFIHFFVDRLGPTKTIAGAILLFLIIATIFSLLYKGQIS